METREAINEEKLASYRALLAGLGIHPSKKDEMIMIVRRMMKAWVDAAYGEDSVQIVLGKRIKDSFQDAVIDVKSIQNEIVEQRGASSAVIVDPDMRGENSNHQSNKGFEP